ncbi:MAG: HAMP domain-containing protein [Desulfurivibrio sp.]|nr:MAG: HAMP domain-containing protein [Desulfurivibrio sp.]
MSLKNKIIILLLCLFGVYAVMEYGVQRFVLLPAFVRLELNAARSNTERAIQALEREVELLIPSATDWATWDDTYQFMADRNADYHNANLNAVALESLKANLLAFYDVEGRRVWGLGYDFDNGQEMALGELSEAGLRLPHPLLGSPGTEETVAGLYRTAAGIFLMASRPILTSEGEGPGRGRVVIGRLLNEEAIQRLGTQARVDLRVETLQDGQGMPPPRNTNAGTIGFTPIQLREDGETTHGTATVLDLTGRPILVFQVDTPRSIVAQGRTTLQYASLSLAAAGTLVLLVLLVFLRHTVFAPLSLLSRHAKAIGTQGDLNARLRLEREDEIGTLAREFDVMVERLAETRQRLMEQSYQSGIAEMASGALHNIGNAITPIGVKLINLRRELTRAPVAEMAMAGAELADPATPADRRADLAQFSELAGTELASLVTRAADELDAMRTQIDHVQMILADQRRFSLAQRTTEPLVLHRLISETAELLPEELRGPLHIEIDEGIAAIGRIYAPRIALQQVISNILINAAESIAAGDRGKKTGRIRVYAGATEAGRENLAHVCFEDNGTGIAPEVMPRLFERGFSSKTQGSGIGLHWSANTMTAMGGRIYATSAGSGQGACLHLLLPLAEQANTTTENTT